MTDLHIGPGFRLPLRAATETMGILAVKRAGKSNAAVVIAEEMHAAGIPWVAIDPKGDWWGITGRGDGGPGLPVLVMGGEHQHIPLEPTAGEVVADFIVRERITCVLDVSEFSKADQRRFLTAFALRLYKTNREPLHVFCEEADEYIPQRVGQDQTKMVGAFETLVKRGGFRGIGITLVTQRSASLNNDVLTQVGTLFALRTAHKADRDKVKGWIEYHAGAREVLSEIGGLDDGEAFVISPSWLRTVDKRIKFRRRKTFDSGATPEVGVERKVPKSLADVDLDAVTAAMADTIEKAKADDPKHLRALLAAAEKRATDLARQVEEARAEQPEPVTVEVPTLTATDMLGIESLLSTLDDHTRLTESLLTQVREEADHIKHALADLRIAEAKAPAPVRTIADKVTVRREDLVQQPSIRSIVQAEQTRTPGSTPGDLTGPQRLVLSALAQHGPRDTARLAVLTNYSVGGGFKNILGGLRTLGYISPARVTPIEATQEGIDALGDFEPLPTGPDLLDWWLTRLKPSEQKIILALQEHGPLDMASLAASTGYEVAGGFKNILGHLRSLGIITPARVTPIALHEDMT